jgi:Cft2 family RNA processing exonuclease
MGEGLAPAYIAVMRFTELLCATPGGIYCPPGDFYIDPTRQVARALITHGHSDHARRGHDAVFATSETLKIMAERHGSDFAGRAETAKLGERMMIKDAAVTFHPAGHVLGSAQIAVEMNGTRIVASGDYKRRSDPTCLPFEPIPCDVFITEATFALPVFRHPDDRAEIRKLLSSVAQFPERTHLVGAYALGKAQRVIALIREAGRRYQSRRTRAGDARQGAQKGLRRHYRDRSALGLRRSLGAALRRSCFILRVGLDADPPAREADGRRAASRHLRPFRLG